MTGKYEHVLAFALDHPWAITPSYRRIIAGILARRIAGQDADLTAIKAAINARSNLPQPKRVGAVAVIPIYGVIAAWIDMLSEISGGTFEALTGQLHEALANQAIKTILFVVNSPGGNVAGTTEFAAEVLKARTRKPIIAQVNHLMAGAAYWPMACATQIIASPSAMVGSIGVVAMHEDVSEALAQLGVEREVLAAEKFKGEGIGGGTLTEDARGHLQGLVDSTYATFIADIAKGRGITAAGRTGTRQGCSRGSGCPRRRTTALRCRTASRRAVRNGYGEGRIVNAEDALALGMVDRIASLTDTLGRVMHTSPASAREDLVDPSIAATCQECRRPRSRSREAMSYGRTPCSVRCLNAISKEGT